MKASSKFGILLLAIPLITLSIAAACSSGDGETPERTPPETKATATSHETTGGTAIWTGNPVVRTEYGKVKATEDESDTWVWKAIPYAEPPLGDLRWKAPQDPESWEGIREETKFCQACPQYDPITGDSVVGSEDCLYLNVWRPQSEETNLPVYVWIHGGGNSTGSANQVPTYYGTSVAQESNMVFVSLNYRLGPLGWFTHPSLRNGDQLDDSGNYGTLDIIKALEWIQENIEAFGGDPNSVIVTGESAGAVNVFSLLMSPAAEGFFHTAMAQSGMAVSTPVVEGEKSSNDVILTLLINDGLADDKEEARIYLEETPDTETAAYLRSKTPDEILGCYEQRGFGLLALPHIFRDGAVIPAEGTGTFENCTYPNKVPLILGSNKEELKMFLFMNPAFEGRDELYQIVTSYGSDLWKVAAVDDVARKISQCPEQPPIYAYQFNWGAGWESGESPIPEPWDLKIGAAHSLDIPFFLGNPCFNVIMTNWVFTEQNRAGREALSSAMMAYVAEFARTGSPGKPAANLPEWKPWANEPEKPKCIIFDADLDNAKIEMSNVEFTETGIIDRMKSEVPESLLSEALNFISSEWTVSHLLNDD
ncbi:MAG: carboxylesterase family protein [Dehalococcoidia bacterium]